jgi:O-antigen/teichoic acid export membrane protein
MKNIKTKIFDVVNSIKSFADLKSGHSRSIKIKKNVYASILIKVIGLAVGFILIRITLDYIDKERYGVWLTLASFLQWAILFELGLGNGLRNKLASALAKDELNLGKIYVSTTYFLVTGIVLIISCLFFILNPFLNWVSILNATTILKEELYIISIIVFGNFFLQFILKLITNILYADQLPAVADAIAPMSNILILIQVFLLSQFTDGNLIYLSIVMSINPVIVYLILSIWLFSGKYKKIRPNIRYIKLSYGKSLISLGMNFFIIGISNIIILQSSNLIIAHLFSPSEVTVYSVAYKLFSMPAMIFNIVNAPLWSAYTEAWIKGEIGWIKRSIKKMKIVWSLLVLANVFLLILSPYIFKIWLGGKIEVPITLSFGLVLFFSIINFGRIFLLFINGVSKLRLQLISIVVGSIIFIPLSIFLVKYLHLGLISIPIAMIISQFKNYLIAPVQYKKLINQTAKGIWNK